MKKDPILESPLPNNQDAERAVLGAIVLDNGHIDSVTDVLKPGDFFNDLHKNIFSSILMLTQQGKPVDLPLLKEYMASSGFLVDTDVPRLSAIFDGSWRGINVKHYANIVKEKSHLRSLVMLSNASITDILQKSATTKDVIERIDTEIAAVREHELMGDSAPMKMDDVIDRHMEQINRLYEGKMILGTPTGYAKLDGYLAGWIPGDFVVLAARPSNGKTALALEFAYRQASKGNNVLIFSLEMTRVDLLFRLISLVGAVNSHRLRAGMAQAADRSRMMEAVAKIRQLPMWISDPTKMWSSDLVTKIRFFAARHNVKFVVLDYLQLLRAKTGGNRVEEVSKISQDVKEAARILGKVSGGTLLANAQLSRLAPHEQPHLESLRESGAIEQDADVVMFIWNIDEDTTKSTKVLKMLGIAKQRNGPVGKIPMIFDSPYTAFQESEEDVWGDHAERKTRKDIDND
jgi:replicative DNA helicase